MYNEGWDNSWSNITIDASIAINNWTISATGIASSTRSSGSAIEKRHTVTDTTTLSAYYLEGEIAGYRQGAYDGYNEGYADGYADGYEEGKQAQD